MPLLNRPTEKLGVESLAPISSYQVSDQTPIGRWCDALLTIYPITGAEYSRELLAR